jgi:hypothetical protein
MKRREMPALARHWRTIYSALVGQWAGRRKVWVDVPPQADFGRWSQWQKSDIKSGKIITCRSIAGHCQELRERRWTGQSVPLMYAVITAHVRYLMQMLAVLAGRKNCIAINADCLWLTQDGWDAINNSQVADAIAPARIAVKAVWDRAWMSGQSVCVVESKGRKLLRCPGVGSDAEIGASGCHESLRALHWAECSTVDAASGVGRRRAKYPGQSIVERYGYPAEVLPWADRYDDPLLPAELLEPVQTGRTIHDGENGI